MTPTITAMRDPTLGSITSSNMAQSIEIDGTGFTKEVINPDGSITGMALIDLGPDPANRSNPAARSGQVSKKGTPQGLWVLSDTLALAIMNFPINSNGPHEALMIGPDGSAAGFFSYSVG